MTAIDNKHLPILLVDDDAPTLLVLRHMLERAGYTSVHSTTDPYRVPELFTETRPRLVLMDLHMPNMEGLELMQQLHEMTDERTRVPCLVLTADETEATKRRALSVGARDFLVKPVDHVELLLRVRNLLNAQRLQDRLSEQNEDLERQRVGLLRDMQAMQAALVPEIAPRLGDLAVSVAYQPAEGPAAGGDFYDMFVPGPGKVAILIGDVAGHGREALTHAALTRYTLRAYLQAGLEPRAALAMAGRVLVDRTGERYATVAVGLYDSRARTLTYALAGHPPPILIELGSSPYEPVTVCSSPPIGWGIPTGRRQTSISLANGAAACFFSDGLIEARLGEELFGRAQLHALLASLGPRPQAAELLEGVRVAAGRIPDDMVACVISPETPSSEEPFRIEELEVDATMLEGPAVRRFMWMCAVTSSQIKRTLARAGRVVASSGTALLRVRVVPSGTTVTVSRPGAATVPGIATARPAGLAA